MSLSLRTLSSLRLPDASTRPNLSPPLKEKGRARPGFEPGTSRTQSENHTPRPTSHSKSNAQRLSLNLTSPPAIGCLITLNFYFLCRSLPLILLSCSL